MGTQIERRPAPGAGATQRRGFTLVELLVVIAVIAVLAGLLFPVLAHARERARQMTCLSNLRQIGTAHLLYLDDWDGQLPYWWQAGPPRPEPFGAYVYWPERLQPYLQSQDVFRDPSFSWWQPWPPEVKLADYALLTWGPGGSGTASDPFWCWPGPPLSLAQVRRPAEAVQLTDGYTTTSMTGGVVGRHSGGANIGFLDGHAKWMTRAQAYVVTRNEQGSYWYPHVSANR
jgi:prepilin-type N-terminal cleavage/methylation domain-containing protein/prepilin-type processing-associated H-X9-DG protein